MIFQFHLHIMDKASYQTLGKKSKDKPVNQAGYDMEDTLDLFTAAGQGDKERVNQLLQDGANVDEGDVWTGKL